MTFEATGSLRFHGAWSPEPGACKFCPEPPARSYMAAVQPETKIGVGTLLVGKYKVTREIGRGGMAAVYEAENISIGKRVAVKVLAAELSNSAIVIERFFREARAAASVRSPYIVEVYDSGRLEDGRPFIAMELLEGESLYDRMARVRLIDTADDGPHHRPGRQGSDEGPRRQHRPPRPQAREHPPLQGRGRRRDRQDPRFRPREVLRAGEDRREDRAAHARGRGVRHARVHVARAGQGAGERRSPGRPLGARLHDVRVPHRTTRVEHRPGRRDDVRGHRRGAAPGARAACAPICRRRSTPGSRRRSSATPNKRFQTAKELADDLARALGAPPISLVNVGRRPARSSSRRSRRAPSAIAALQERQGPASSRGGLRKPTPGVGMQPQMFPDKTTSEPIDLLGSAGRR